jgi:hypothetical protein
MIREISLARIERHRLITRATAGPPSFWLRIDGYREARYAEPPALPSLMVVDVGDAEVTLTFNDRNDRPVHPPGRGWFALGAAGTSTAWARPAIPLRPPEDIEEEARQYWRGDPEKVPTTPIELVRIDGVEIKSRYRQRLEFLVLAAAVGSMPDEMRDLVSEVFCDSKAHVINAEIVGDAPVRAARDVANHLDLALVNEGGHSGVTVGDEYREANVRWPS